MCRIVFPFCELIFYLCRGCQVFTPVNFSVSVFVSRIMQKKQQLDQFKKKNLVGKWGTGQKRTHYKEADPRFTLKGFLAKV